MKHPQGGFVADPCLLDIGGRLILFYESCPNGGDRGVLMARDVDPNGIPSNREVLVMEAHHHLSFPGAFVDPLGDPFIYMLPEQAASGCTKLYRSPLVSQAEHLDFSEHSTPLPDIPGIDPVLHWRAPHWYLFVTDLGLGNADDNLRLYCSSSLHDKFIEHPASPIRRGLRGSRMAGQILQVGGQCYRVAQNCRKAYGEHLVLFLIDVLSPTEYLERFVSDLRFPTSAFGRVNVHSLSLTGSFVAVDGNHCSR
jgi:hypothetical protein